MGSMEHKFTMSEQVEILLALDSAIASNTQLINNLRKTGLDNLVEPRIKALTRLEEIRAVLGGCVTLTATMPSAAWDNADKVQHDDGQQIDHVPDEEEPSF